MRARFHYQSLLSEGDDSAPHLSIDPPRGAARILIDAACERVSTTRDELAKPGTVVLISVPTIEWLEPVLTAWRDGADRPKAFENGFEDTFFADKSTSLYYAPTTEPSRNELSSGSQSFASAISSGRNVVAISTSEIWIPNDLVESTDIKLTVESFSLDAFSAFVDRTCSGALAGDADLKAIEPRLPEITPRLLRLAMRPGRSGEDYVRKLLALLSRPSEIFSGTTVASPRAAPTLGRLHGMDEAVTWGRALARDLALYRAGTLEWADVDRGCLLSGPPGCGKTLFARALSATCGVPLFAGSYGEWLANGSAHQGDLLKSMRKCFEDARKSAPSIIFIDEIDSFADRLKVTIHNADWIRGVVNSLLVEIDGVSGREGVVVIGACNHPSALDPAIARSGRLDRHIEIKLPDTPALARILREHLGGDLPGVDLTSIALSATGSSGADCERYVRGARRTARNERRLMLIDDLRREILGNDDLSDEDRFLAATHEVGHALVEHLFHPGAARSVDLTRRAGSSGASDIEFFRRNTIRAGDVSRMLTVLLAGRAAEQVVFGEASSGSGGDSSSDLAKATRLAVIATNALGFDSDRGLIWLGDTDEAEIPIVLLRDPELTTKVGSTLARCYANALEIIRTREPILRRVAALLVERRVLAGAELQSLLDGSGQADAYPSPAPGTATDVSPGPRSGGHSQPPAVLLLPQS